MTTKPTSRMKRFWLFACLTPLVLLASGRGFPQYASEGRFMRVSNHEEVWARQLNLESVQLAREGRYDEAIEKARRALELTRKVFGRQHRNVAADLVSLANIYIVKGDYFNAEPMLREAVEIDTALFGADHPEVGVDVASLGYLLWKQGDPIAGEIRLRKGVRLLATGTEDGSYLVPFAKYSKLLGDLYVDRHQYSKGLQRYLIAVLVYEVIDKREAANVLVTMAEVERVQGKYRSAEIFMQRARELSGN